MRRLFSRSGFSVNIAWKWWPNCKLTCLSQSPKECKICNLYGWRFRSVCRMCQTLLSEMRNAWACLLVDRLGPWPTDANTQAVFSVVWTEDSPPGDWLHATEPSSHRCLTHRWTAFGDGASCWFISWRNQCWVSIVDPVPISSSTSQIPSLPPQWCISTNFKDYCFS